MNFEKYLSKQKEIIYWRIVLILSCAVTVWGVLVDLEFFTYTFLLFIFISIAMITYHSKEIHKKYVKSFLEKNDS